MCVNLREETTRLVDEEGVADNILLGVEKVGREGVANVGTEGKDVGVAVGVAVGVSMPDSTKASGLWSSCSGPSKSNKLEGVAISSVGVALASVGVALSSVGVALRGTIGVEVVRGPCGLYPNWSAINSTSVSSSLGSTG